jgi:hypothetical protein
MKVLKLTIILLLGGLLNQCSVQKGLTDTDSTLKNLKPVEGKALVYLIRPSTIAFAIDFYSICDDIALGSIGAKKYLYAMIDPGKHTFITQAENDRQMELEVLPNKTYYIHIIPQLGVLKARANMALLDDEEGQKKLAKCKLSKTNQFSL